MSKLVGIETFQCLADAELAKNVLQMNGIKAAFSTGEVYHPLTGESKLLALEENEAAAMQVPKDRSNRLN